MGHRIASSVVLVGGIVLLMNAQSAAQGVTGSGTPGTLPVWTGDGTMQTDSHVQDNGASVNFGLPIAASGSGSGPAVFGSGGVGVGINGISTGSHGIVGSTSDPNSSGVYGSTSGSGNGVTGQGVLFGVGGFATGAPDATHCCVTGVIGSATNTGATGFAIGVGGYVNTPNGWGTQGLNQGGGVGVLAQSQGGNGRGVGLLATSDTGNGISAYSGTGIGTSTIWVVNYGGGDILDGAGCPAPDPTGQNCSYPSPGFFSINNGGDLAISGNAFKPGGGSWSILSDRRAKKSIHPIDGALQQLLKLRGVTYEYTNPSEFHELPGTHMGMVAQDVEQVFPSWVDTGTNGYKRLTFRGFEAVAVEAVRELDARVTANSDETTARIADLEKQNLELRHAIEVLSETVKALQQR